MKSADIDHCQWNIESLNKAYHQGFLFGLGGEQKSNCPYQSDVIAAAWEAGWLDAQQQHYQQPHYYHCAIA